MTVTVSTMCLALGLAAGPACQHQQEPPESPEWVRQAALVEVGGVWVEPDAVAEAQKGVFRHRGARVSRGDKIALLEGRVPHPVTGEFIPKADIDRAERGMFPLPGGRWGSVAEADVAHADPDTPWVLRHGSVQVMTTLPMADHAQVTPWIDEAVAAVLPLFGGVAPSPAVRPTVVVCPTTAEYRAVGTQIGAESSVYGAFVGSHALAEMMFAGVELTAAPAVANFGEAGWGVYYLRHATGLAVAQALAKERKVRLPAWWLTGVGAYAERMVVPSQAAFFAEQFAAKGGVAPLGDWFADFQITVDMTGPQLEHLIFQAGLVVAFAARSHDPEVGTAMAALGRAFARVPTEVERCLQRLESVLMTKDSEIGVFLDTVRRQG